MYGLGPGDIIGARNVMDVSQPYGMVYGEGVPDGGAYFRATDQSRGHFLLAPLGLSNPELGIPNINREIEAVSAIWIAKTAAIPSLTEGLLGIMVGSSKKHEDYGDIQSFTNWFVFSHRAALEGKSSCISHNEVVAWASRCK